MQGIQFLNARSGGPNLNCPKLTEREREPIFVGMFVSKKRCSDRTDRLTCSMSATLAMIGHVPVQGVHCEHKLQALSYLRCCGYNNSRYNPVCRFLSARCGAKSSVTYHDHGLRELKHHSQREELILTRVPEVNVSSSGNRGLGTTCHSNELPEEDKTTGTRCEPMFPKRLTYWREAPYPASTHKLQSGSLTFGTSPRCSSTMLRKFATPNQANPF